MSKTLMWFRKDLRFDDNTAFNQLLEQTNGEEECICIFQLNPAQFLKNSWNHAAFFKSLETFRRSAEAKGIPLHFLYGDVSANFHALKKAFPEWETIYFNKDERGYGYQRDQKMRLFFEEQAITVYAYQDSHLLGVGEVTKATGEPYKVFTPYFKQWQQQKKRRYQKTSKHPISFQRVEHALFAEGQQAFQKIINELELPTTYECGEIAAENYLKVFIDKRLHGYDANRDFPALDETSKLSRFLRTGELSIRKVWHAVMAEPESKGRTTFISELCWRDFYNMVYAENPDQKTKAIKKEYRTLKWNQSERQFDCWKNGETGFPIVDAAMKQLNETGWMHNRLRMIVASFLTKDLLINWEWGEAYFQQMLIDYDPASNIGGWQWAASTGTDAAPYFRIFNPTTQSERFDAKGDFIRQYVPSLKNVPNKYIHEPHKMSEAEQKKAKCLIGKDYPKPLVDHQKMRPKILAFFKEQSE